MAAKKLTKAEKKVPAEKKKSALGKVEKDFKAAFPEGSQAWERGEAVECAADESEKE